MVSESKADTPIDVFGEEVPLSVFKNASTSNCDASRTDCNWTSFSLDTINLGSTLTGKSLR